MKIIGFRSFDFAGTGYRCTIPADAKPYISIQPQVLSRVNNSPTFGPAIIGERTIPVEFIYNGQAMTYEEAWNRLLVQLNIYDTRPGQLRAQRNDGALVYCDAILALSNAGSFSGMNDIRSLPAIFTSVDPFWKSLAPSTAVKTFSNPLDRAFAVPIVTGLSDEPVITIKPTANRTGGGATAGFKFHRVERITNNTGVPIVNEPYALAIGDTAALVTASKMLASGNDVRVFRDGVEVARTLTGMNSAATLVWVNVPNLAVGATMDFEVAYGNASAGAPTLTLAGSSPIDFATSTNAIWKYPIDDVTANAGKGGWKLSSGIETPVADTGVAGAWKWATTLQSSDDMQQDRYSSYVDSGTKYRAVFAAERARGGGGLVTRVETTRGDGVSLFSAAAITQVRVDMEWLNDYEVGTAGNAIGRLVLLSSVDGMTWNVVQEWTGATALAAIAVANYPIPSVRHVAFAVWPRSGTLVPSTATAGRRVFARWTNTLEVTRNAALIPQSTVQVEEAVYEYALELRLGGGDPTVAPYKVLRIGGSADRRLTTRLNEVLRLDTGARTAEVWNADQSQRVSTPSILAVQSAERVVGASGEQASGKWLDLQPYINPLSNPSAVVDTSGWSATLHANATGNFQRATGAFKTTPASFAHVLTASTVPTATIAGTAMNTQDLPVAGRSRIVVAADQRTTNANLEPVLRVSFYDAAKSLISSVDAAAWSPVANVWYRRILGAAVPVNAAYFRVGSIVRTKAANAIGTVFFDDIQPNGLDLIVTDLTGDIGTIDVTVEWLTQFI